MKLILKPRSQGISTQVSQHLEDTLPILAKHDPPRLFHTGRAEKVYVAGDGPVTQPIKRREPKRPPGISARQWKKIRGKGTGGKG